MNGWDIKESAKYMIIALLDNPDHGPDYPTILKYRLYLTKKDTPKTQYMKKKIYPNLINLLKLHLNIILNNWLIIWEFQKIPQFELLATHVAVEENDYLLWKLLIYSKVLKNQFLLFSIFLYGCYTIY